MDQPERDDLPARRPPTRRPTTGSASSRRAASCRSPAIRRSAAATPGSSAAACRRRRGRVVQQCAVGLVDIRSEAGRTAFAAPPLAHAERSSRRCSPQVLRGARARRAATSSLRNGSTTARAGSACCCATPATVLALTPDHAALQQPRQGRRRRRRIRRARNARSRCGRSPSMVGIDEDPVTGSLNAGVAEWLIGAGRAPERYVAAQGAKLGRAGRVHVSREDGALLDRRHAASAASAARSACERTRRRRRSRSSPTMSSSPRAASRKARRWCEATLGVDAGRRRPARDHGHAQPPARPRRRRPSRACTSRSSPSIPRRRRRRGRAGSTSTRRRCAAEIAAAPRLVHWVARCNDIDRAIAALRAAGHDPGEAIAAERMTAHGLLRWRITAARRRPAAGGGAVPLLIEWGAAHPCDRLPASGVSVARHRHRRRRCGAWRRTRRGDGGRGRAAAIGLVRHAARARRAARRLARAPSPGAAPHSLR